MTDLSSKITIVEEEPAIRGIPGAPTSVVGAVGITVDKKDEVPKAVEQMLAEKRPCVVDFRVEREENVWPMVPAGKSLSDMDGLGILESMA